jgi:hypothetical protein
MLSKNVDNKKCLPKLVLFNEKKMKKDSDNIGNNLANVVIERPLS